MAKATLARVEKAAKEQRERDETAEAKLRERDEKAEAKLRLVVLPLSQSLSRRRAHW